MDLNKVKLMQIINKKNLPFLILLVTSIYFFTSFMNVFAQNSNKNLVPISEENVKTVLDDSFYISARAAGMGGALSTLADGVHGRGNG